ncbi:WD40/YVTN/BNR-like repeat-containing protein [Mucilaginibacter lutimaris]|uniref:WD40/YVTN/BNR-like repeat-containing protein n=1 Tax=Mucilaginibacter lutimaris TaxID=931629 RepID=A0ABW2ZHE5_9SPHI
MKNKKMKRLFVFVPAILVVAFLLNSFVIKEKKEVDKTTVKANSSPVTIIYKSADGGQTWQDISAGLPENLRKEGVRKDGFFANENGFYLRAGNGLYHNESNPSSPSWTKEIVPAKQRNIAPASNGMFAYNFRGQFLRKVNGQHDWVPMFKNFQEQAVRLNGTKDWMYENFTEKQVSSVFENTAGTVFVGSNNAIYRSGDKGKTWKYVQVAGWVNKMVELNGVILAASSKGILRSTDNGEHWDSVMDEGGAGIAVEPIAGGFAAIVNNTTTQINTIHISLDGGKNWSEIGEELQPSQSSLHMKKIGLSKTPLAVLAIKQMGKYLICGRTDGIFRSADMGKTWEQLPLPAIGNLGFDLSVSGNVIYVVPNKGC